MGCWRLATIKTFLGPSILVLIERTGYPPRFRGCPANKVWESEKQQHIKKQLESHKNQTEERKGGEKCMSTDFCIKWNHTSSLCSYVDKVPLGLHAMDSIGYIVARIGLGF